MPFPQVEWIAALAILALPLVALLLVLFTSRDRLMRCPETGGVAFVDADPLESADGDTVPVGVRRCDLWPEFRTCGRGCLARYPETAPGHRVRLQALRPFESQ